MASHKSSCKLFEILKILLFRKKPTFLVKSSGRGTVEFAEALYNYYRKDNNAIPRYVIESFMWDFKFLNSFLRLKSYGDYGLLDVTHTLLEAWNNPGDPLSEVSKIKQELRADYCFPKIPLLPAANMVDDDMIPSANVVLEFIDTFAENLNPLVVTNDPSSSLLAVEGPKDQLEEVLQELKLLRFYILFVSRKCTEPETLHVFFTHVLVEASHIAMVAWLYAPFQHNESQALAQNQALALSKMNALLSDLLEMKIKPIHKIYIDVLRYLKLTIQPGLHPYIIQNRDAAADSGFAETPTNNLVELPSVSNSCQTVCLNDQIAILQEMLNLLRATLIHPPIVDFEFHLQNIDTAIVDAGLLIYSLYNIKGEKERTTLKDVNRAFGLDLPSNIQPIKEVIYLIIRRAFQSNLPRIYGLGSVDALLNNLNEFQGRYSDSLLFVKNQLQSIQKEFESTRPFLKDVAEEHATLLSGKAYEVEFVIYACIRKEFPQWCLQHWLSDIIEEIIVIRSEGEFKKMKLLPHDSRDTSTEQITSALPTTPRMTEEIVGFEDVRKELKKKLLKGCRELDVLSIVGMPGLGKTTLANQLYSDQSIISHFDICAQCCVSQVYKRKELLRAILHDATGETPSSSTNEADIADKLRRTLMAKRYLILLDDVWEYNVWDDLSSCFSDSKNGSRIILTTRHLEVANYAKSISEPIPLRMFNDEESWRLLEDKVFGKESGCISIKEIGKQIAKRCGGLPLSVVLVAGILAKVEKKEESWKEVATTLSSQILSDSMALIEQSYQDLPCHLKPCFLYFGTFLEDRITDASTLTRLWISESFIKSCEGKSLEVIAQGYLEELIARNLVMASKRNYLDSIVEAFIIHDLLLEFCKKRAARENFLQWIKGNSDATHPSCIYSHKQNAQPRLAFFEINNLVEQSSSYSLVRSVFSWHTGSNLEWKVETSGIFHNFRFVKVLHLEHYVHFDDFPTNLAHLKYFSAKTTRVDIPPSISNLWNLETLILKKGFGAMFIPATIWKLVKLRNLHLSSFSVESAEELTEDASKLHELRTLSTPVVDSSSDLKLLFRKAPNLRELTCEISGLRRGMKAFVVDFPTHLEKLHISRKFAYLAFPVFISSSNVKELTVVDFKMSIQHLSNIAQLKKLQALRLRGTSFDDDKWEVSNDEFLELRVLELEECFDFKEWNVSDDAFPNLERLVLNNCCLLKEIPSSFRDISSLKSIEVRDCKKSVEDSARDIRETQVEDYQNTAFKLSITVSKLGNRRYAVLE